MIRINSGWLKGVSLEAPPGDATRPTRSRVREASLNLIQSWISQSSVLDLFAGSGAFGIEFLSRGGSSAVFVEFAKPAQACLERNLLKVSERASKQPNVVGRTSLIKKDVYSFLSGTTETFDVVWADPPYAELDRLLENIGAILSKILRPEGIFVLESAAEDQEKVRAWFKRSEFELVKDRRYGVTLISVVRLKS